MKSSPQGVRQAILTIWGTLAISAISALIAKLAGMISQGEFAFTIIVYAILCIVPYRLAKRSNAARYVYLVLIVISYLFLATGFDKVNKIDLFASILLTPAEVFILYRLFQPEASAWYTSKQFPVA